MNEDILKKYEEYKRGISNKERYKLLANFVATNPSDVNGFLESLKGKKGTYSRRNRAIKRWLDELCEKSLLTKKGDNQYQISPFVAGFKSQELIMSDQVDKLAIETLITEDNMVQLYFSETQRRELANLLSTRAYQQIFTNGKVKYPFSGEEEFGVERTHFTATFETYRIGGKNKVVLVDEPNFAKNNSEEAVDAVYQARISWATDYKHNKKSIVKNIKDRRTGQVKSRMMNVVNYDKDSFKKQMKELGVGQVNIEKMFNGSTEMVGRFKLTILLEINYPNVLLNLRKEII